MVLNDIHIDIMDGHFVPSLTFGPLIVKMIRNSTNLPFDVHMMVTDPQNYVSDLAAAGADMMTLHAESPIHLHRAVYQVKEAGMKVGVALSLRNLKNIGQKHINLLLRIMVVMS